MTEIRPQNPLTYGWNWAGFAGSEAALALNRRDLQAVDAVLRIVTGRTAALQAGGNLGLFPKRLAQVFTTVYTFEPSVSLFPALQHNAPESNILKFQAALGDARGLHGTACVRREGKHKKPHEGVTHMVADGVVPTLRIDDLALPVCDLIYLDIEGWELYALRGAAETLARCRPAVVVEVGVSIALVGLTAEDVRAAIRSAGYRFVTRLLSDEVFLPAEAA